MKEERITRLQGNAGGWIVVGISCLLATAFSLLCLFALAFIYSATDLTEESARMAVRVITYISVLLAGMIAGRAAAKRGWLRGMAAGVLYLLSVRLIGMVWTGEMDHTLFLTLLWGALLGAAGGIIGINLPRRKRR